MSTSYERKKVNMTNGNNNNNESFFFDVGSFKSIDGSAVYRQLNMFYVFSYEKGSKYFTAPSLCLKIKTFSEFDNTEVKAFITPDRISALHTMLVMFYKEHKPVNMTGSKYNVFLYPVQDKPDKFTLKIVSTDRTSNDISLNMDILVYIIKIMDSFMNSMAFITLSFINMRQIDDMNIMMNDMKCLMSKMVYNNNNSNTVIAENECVMPKNTFPGFNNIQPVVDIDNDLNNAVEEDNNSSSVIEDEPDMNDIDTGIGNDNMAKDITSTSDDTDKIDVFTKELDIVANETPEMRMKRIMTDIMDDAFDNKIEKETMLNSILEKIHSTDICSINDLSSYTGLNAVTLNRYFNKLTYVLKNRNMINGGIPVFTMNIVKNNEYAKNIKDTAEAMYSLFVSLKNDDTNGNLDDRGKFRLACLRFVFAPVWTSYIHATSNNVNNNDEFRTKLSNSISMTLSRSKGSVESVLDAFMSKNNLTYNIEESNVNKLLEMACPVLNSMFINEKDITALSIKEVNDLINDIMNNDDTNDYYSILKNHTGFNPSLYTPECLGVIFTCIKYHHEVKNSKLFSDVMTYYNKSMEDKDNMNELFKGITAIDNNDDDMSIPF